MVVYMDLVVMLNFLVDLLLIMGTNQLSGYPMRMARGVASAAMGSGYAAICMTRPFRFLGGPFWRLAVMVLMCAAAFGWDRSALRRGALFVLLSMALGGVVSCINGGDIWTLLVSAAAIAGICSVGVRRSAGGVRYVSVQIRNADTVRSFLALEDTGNSLKDPVTGCSVLIVGANIAWEVLGLTPKQLLDPIGTVETTIHPGLRLIPYRSVGQPNGMLLCKRFDEIRINGAVKDMLVAFAPENIGGNEGFEALTGGGI